ncbi:MAG: MFS transporter [Actinomycetota bacterium]
MRDDREVADLALVHGGRTIVAGRLRRLLPRGPIWHRGDFVRLWSAATVSNLGTQVSLLAIPFVAIKSLHATTLEVAALGAAGSAPLLLFGLPAGAWVDRLRKRPVMLAGDLGCCLALGSIPIARAAGALTIWQLFAVEFASAGLTIFFDVASQANLPAVVTRDELAAGNAALQVSAQTAQVAGPGLAGLLIGLVGAPFAVAADAASYLASASIVSRVRHVEPPRERVEGRRLRAEIGEGLRFVLGHPIIRPNLAFTATANFFNSIFFSVFILYAVRTLHLSARQVGLVFVCSNLGSLATATLAPRLHRRFGLGRVMLATSLSGWPLLLVFFARGTGDWRIPMLVAGVFVWASAAVIFNITSTTISQATTPDGMLARSASSRRLVAWGTILPATMLGGVLGTYLGLPTTVLVGAAGRGLAGLIILRSPVRHVRTLEDADAIVATV